MMGWGWNGGGWNGGGAWGLASDLLSLVFLEERYARGEIDRQEFLERRHDLQS